MWVAAVGCCVSAASCTMWAPGRAGRTPAEAVRGVFASLSQHYDPELTKVVVFLADDDEEGLLRQLRETRQKLASQGSAYQLSVTNLREAETAAGVTVTIDVAIMTDVPGDRVLFLQTQDEVWTFDTIDDRGPFTLSRGWKVAAVRIPDICVVYLSTC